MYWALWISTILVLLGGIVGFFKSKHPSDYALQLVQIVVSIFAVLELIRL